MTARERAEDAASRTLEYPSNGEEWDDLLDAIEAMFRAHATEAANLARQEWEAQQAEPGFRMQACDPATPRPIDDEFLGP